jgi:hypothetical protein
MQLNWIQSSLIAMGLIIAGYFIGNMHLKGKQYDRYVTVKGLSEREVAADLAIWPINITLAGNNLTLIQSDIEKQKKEVIAFFKTQGFADDELTVGTTNIADSKVDMYGNNNYREFRYIAKTEFTIRTNDLERLKKSLSASLELLSRGILLGSKNDWSPIEYQFTKLNEMKPPMIEEATKNARLVAEKFALDSESKVGKIRNANQGLFSITDRDQNTPEIKIVRIVSTIEYQLED